MIAVKHLFKELDQQLIKLLISIDQKSWSLPTSAKLWTVKDVASHLLDTNLRTLSVQRDGFFAHTPPEGGYRELVNWLNQLNADWIEASRRLSPPVLLFLLEQTGKQVSSYYESLDLQGKAIFPVAWAGEEESLNWMHLAREYTEKWHHQQQIQEAVGSHAIMDPKLFEPVMDTFLLALPNHFIDSQIPVNTCIKLSLTGVLSKSYYLNRNIKELYLEYTPKLDITCEVTLPSEITWKLFCKNIRPSDITNKVTIKGDKILGNHLLEMVAVMA